MSYEVEEARKIVKRLYELGFSDTAYNLASELDTMEAMREEENVQNNKVPSESTEKWMFVRAGNTDNWFRGDDQC